MGNKMLIDATHPEETRVVVTRGQRVEEFDYEAAARKQLRGNIYLAKVARIEPSLQAAFVNYGGNRHGFLAFAEIHSDYYQIPVAVREEMHRQEALERDARSQSYGQRHRYGNVGETAAHQSDDAEAQPEHDVEQQQNTDHRNHSETPSKHDVVRSADETPHDHAILKVNNVNPSHNEDHLHQNSQANGEHGSSSTNHSATDHTYGNEDDVKSVPNGSVMSLDAMLPPVIYEQFINAVQEAEDAQDEIPHADDEFDDETDADEHSDQDGMQHAETLEASQDDEDAKEDGAHSDHDAADHSIISVNKQHRDNHHNDNDSGEGSVFSIPETATPAPIEVVGSEDALEELPQRQKRRWRQYKIQEVIKRNQIVLIQVVKEERGTKGAALTTYLSLAGRYTVLMPNTASGGGISRKITVPADRKRLKEIAQELDVPEGMGLIIRTAGASRTKAEIKRDYEYLLRLWENVRDLTLSSTAPCLVYEEGDLIKRSIRDLYNKDIDEIIVAGDSAFREAQDFMRMLMPSHAKNVQLYKDPEPLFTKHEVERQLNQMFSPVVTLRSGGYIVLNQTEALVAIDVNSGRATREFSIEDTALKTNMEASEEIARQVRLRDLAGLIVIDFIDMDERRNNRSVERKLKECLRFDRARIQVGHISHFGLLEMSRQRLRQGVVEVSSVPCPTCQGVGHVRSTESVGLMILRAIEDHLRGQGAAHITTSVSMEAALYILNHKRTYLRDIENRYSINIVIAADEKAKGGHFTIERSTDPLLPVVNDAPKAIYMDAAAENDATDQAEAAIADEEEARVQRRKRRRRRGRGDNGYDNQAADGHLSPNQGYVNGHVNHVEAGDQGDETSPDLVSENTPSDDGESEPGIVETNVSHNLNGIPMEQSERYHSNRRRGRRGGRRHRDGDGQLHPNQNAFVNHVPGLGDQPSVDFEGYDQIRATDSMPDQRYAQAEAASPVQHKEAAPIMHHADDAIIASMVKEEKALPEVTVVQSVESEIIVLNTVSETIIENQNSLASHELNGNGQDHRVEEQSHQTPEIAAVVEVIKPLITPQPKPVRTGPARKGWWQRKT